MNREKIGQNDKLDNRADYAPDGVPDYEPVDVQFDDQTTKNEVERVINLLRKTEDNHLLHYNDYYAYTVSILYDSFILLLPVLNRTVKISVIDILALYSKIGQVQATLARIYYPPHRMTIDTEVCLKLTEYLADAQALTHPQTSVLESEDISATGETADMMFAAMCCVRSIGDCLGYIQLLLKRYSMHAYKTWGHLIDKQAQLDRVLVGVEGAPGNKRVSSHPQTADDIIIVD